MRPESPLPPDAREQPVELAREPALRPVFIGHLIETPETPAPPDPPPPPEVSTVYERDIQPVWDAFCVSCHSPESNSSARELLDLRAGHSYLSLFGEDDAPRSVVCRDGQGEAETIRMVEPGVPEASALWRKLSAATAPASNGSSTRLQSCGTYPMPPFPGLADISPEAFALVDAWIREGARNASE
jgi:hypothetical protein